MSQESDVCCTTSMYDIQKTYFKTCIITHNNNVSEQNINVSMFDILSVKKSHTRRRQNSKFPRLLLTRSLQLEKSDHVF